MNSRFLSLLTLSVLLLPTGPGLVAQPPQAAARFGEVVNVELVNVEVWVTDSKGRPILGLGADDFEVLEDGHPMQITHFAEIRGGLLRQAAAQAEPSTPPRAEEASVPAPNTPEHLVLYFDDLHMGIQNRRRVIEDFQRFLDAGTVPPERVLILRQTRSLEIAAPFGSTRQELDRSLAGLAKADALAAQPGAAKRFGIQRLQEVWEYAKEQAAAASPAAAGQASDPCPIFTSLAKSELEVSTVQGRALVGTTLDNLNSTVAFLSGLEGVKTLIYMGDDLEMSPGADLVAYVDGLCPGGSGDQLTRVPPEDVTRAFRRLTQHANANRVTIHTLQTSGLQASNFSTSVEQTRSDFRGSQAFDARLRGIEREGLAFLADQTGGRSVFNRNRFEQEFTAIGQDMTSYYSLAYEPPTSGARNEHQIEVRVRGGDFRVRSRRSYYDKDFDQRMTERIESALYLGLIDNPLGARLGAGDVRADGEGFVVPFHVLVPVESVAFLPADGSENAQLKVVTLIRHLANGKVTSQDQVFDVPRPPADASIDLLDLRYELQLPQGVHVVAVGVRDQITQESSFLATTLQLQPQDTAAGGP